MAIASMLGADLSLCVSIVAILGLIGASCGAYILDRADIKEPVARGLGVGESTHRLGTAALSNDPDDFPFAAMYMVYYCILLCCSCMLLLAVQGSFGLVPFCCCCCCYQANEGNQITTSTTAA
jgi:putative effector of murein hydrolase